MKKKKAKSKLPAVKIPEYTTEQIELALKNNQGHVVFTAAELKCPVENLKSYLKKSKYLRNILFDIRETMVDLAEDTLAWRMKEKKDVLAAMFTLKCWGQKRGWVDKPNKAGETANKPIYIRILPVNENGDTPKKAGRPKKQFAEIKVSSAGALPAANDDDDIIEGELE